MFLPVQRAYAVRQITELIYDHPALDVSELVLQIPLFRHLKIRKAVDVPVNSPDCNVASLRHTVLVWDCMEHYKIVSGLWVLNKAVVSGAIHSRD